MRTTCNVKGDFYTTSLRYETRTTAGVFLFLFLFHHCHRKQKRFSIKMCQPLPMQMGKSFRIHTSSSNTVHVTHSTIWTLSTIVATLGSSVLIWAFHVLHHLRASNIIFRPEKLLLKYAPFSCSLSHCELLYDLWTQFSFRAQ